MRTAVETRRQGPMEHVADLPCVYETQWPGPGAAQCSGWHHAEPAVYSHPRRAACQASCIRVVAPASPIIRWMWRWTVRRLSPS